MTSEPIESSPKTAPKVAVDYPERSPVKNETLERVLKSAKALRDIFGLGFIELDEENKNAFKGPGEYQEGDPLPVRELHIHVYESPEAWVESKKGQLVSDEDIKSIRDEYRKGRVGTIEIQERMSTPGWTVGMVYETEDFYRYYDIYNIGTVVAEYKNDNLKNMPPLHKFESLPDVVEEQAWEYVPHNACEGEVRWLADQLDDVVTKNNDTES